MNMNSVKKILAVMLASSLMAMPIIAGATDAPTPTPPPSADVTNAAPVTVGGTSIKSDVAGSFAIPATAAIQGVALRQSKDTIKAAAGLAKNEAPYVRAYEISAKKSPAAYACFNAAAATVGGTVIDAVNIDLGKMAGGKFSGLPAGTSVPTTVGVKNANGRTLAVAKAQPGGATEIIQDQDDNPNTVTFPVSGGLAGYGIIAYNK